MAYDEKYKRQAVDYHKEGHTIEETAKAFNIGTTTLKTWVQQYDETGNLKIKPIVRKHKKIDPEKLETYVDQHPDAYLPEIAKEFNCLPSAVRKALMKLNIKRKKTKRFKEQDSGKVKMY